MTSKQTSWMNKLSRLVFHHQSIKGYLEPVIQVFKPAWRDGAFRAKVIAVSELSEQVLAVELKPEAKWPLHLAGQHILLTVENNGRLMSRTFTIASSSEQALHQGIIRLVIKQNALGAFTPALNSVLKPNLWLNISRPMGDFTFDANLQNHLFVAGGSGITPFIAKLHEHLPRAKSPITLLYFAKPHQHLLVDELMTLADHYPYFNVKFLNRVEHGDVSGQLSDYPNHHISVCGPQSLYQQVASYCEQNDIGCASEHFAPLAWPSSTNINDSDGEQVEVKHNGKALLVDQAQSLLMHFKQKGIQVNSGCGMGICHQCQCTKRRGIVRDMRTGKLSDMGEELIQLCISQAVTEVELES